MRNLTLGAVALLLALSGCQLPMASQMNSSNDKNSSNYTGGTVAPVFTAFSFVGGGGGSNPATTATGIITENPTNSTIAVTVPSGTDLTKLVATFATSPPTGPTVKLGTAVQTSGTTQNDFTRALVYQVVGTDGSSRNYSVSVTVASSSAKDITAFTFSGSTNTTISAAGGTTGTISITVPFGTVLNPLTPQQISFAGTSISPAAGTAQNFSSPVVYTVTAADGSTKAYTVTVTAALNPAKAMTSFSFLTSVASNVSAGTLSLDSVGKISGTTITVTVPFGTTLNHLTPTFTTTGSSVTVNAAAQTSGTTENVFGSAVTYTVTAADGTTQNYSVNTLYPVAVVYAATSGPSIVANVLNTSTGALTPVTGSPYTTPVSMLNLASDPLGRVLLGSQATNVLYAYQITPGTGQLTALTVTPSSYLYSVSGSPAFDPKGKFAYVLISGAVGVTAYIYPVSPTSGSFGASFITSSLGNFTPGQLQFAPNGKYALLPDTVAAGFIHYFSVDQTTGALTAMSNSTQAWSSAGTRLTAIDKTSQYVVGASTIVSSTSGTIGSLVVSPPAWSINNLPVTVPSSNFLSGLLSWDPTGTFVVVGANSTTGFLYSYTLSGGSLSLGASFGYLNGLSSAPNSMAFSMSGQSLFVGDSTGTISGFNVTGTGLSPSAGNTFFSMASKWLTVDPTGQYLLGTGQGATGFVNSYQIVSASTLTQKGNQSYSSGGTTNALTAVSVSN